MKIRFNAKPARPFFDGPGGHWNAGQVKDVPDEMGGRLLGLYDSSFVEVKEEEKAIHAPEDKMMHGAPENKNLAGAEVGEESENKEAKTEAESPPETAHETEPLEAAKKKGIFRKGK